MSEATNEYLTEQINILKRSAKLNYATAVILCVLLMGYGGFAFWAMGPFTDSEQLTDFALYQASVKGPAFIKAAEGDLEKSAPVFAEALGSSLQKAIPELRISAQRTLTGMVDGTFARSATQLTEITRAYLETHDFAPKAQNETLHDYADRVAQTLASDFGENLDRQFVAATGANLNEFGQNTETVLNIFDAHLNELAQSPLSDLSRTQKAERLLIAYIIKNFLPKQ